MILITGGAGFIGANLIHHWLAQEDEPLLNLDKLTYAGNPDNLKDVEQDPRYEFVLGDTPIPSTQLLWVQLFDQAMLPLSEQINFDTFEECDKNLILINFNQVR